MSKASDFLKRHGPNRKEEDEHFRETEEDHSLQGQAKERAEHHPEHLNAGTPYDWEEVEDYRKELDRLDREGPGSSSTGKEQ